MMKKRTIKIIFFTFTFLLLLLVLSLFFLALRQSVRYNRVLAEYQASRLSVRLTELYLSGEELTMADLEENTLGFGVYTGTGQPVLRFGDVPAQIEDLHPGYAGETVLRDKNHLTVIRSSGRGRMRQDHIPGQAGRERIITILVVDDRNTRNAASFLFVLTLLLFLAFLALSGGIVFLYRRIDRLKAEEGKNLQLIRLGQAARVLTHEIKNPLGAIRIQEQILRKKLPEEFKPSLSVIGEETARIARLTDRVGEFLKHPEGTPSEVDLVSTLQELIHTMPGTITIKLNTGESAKVRIDPDNLRSVFENILTNAVLSGGPDSPVTITVDHTKGGYTVSVADNGPGIDPASADRIFDIFYTTRTSGSGIGLAVAKAFIEAAGGSITARNRPEGGAVFTVILPEYRD